jgi:uncharacterized protein YidB (DUF937 family)
MARGMPSFKALLALAAVVGWQNRDKLGEMVKELSAPGGAFDKAKQQAGVDQPGTTLKKGLEEMMKKFDKSGEGETARSWVGTGENKPIDEPRLEKAAGPDLIGDLATQLGISREELLKRLTQVLPATIDKVTPAGRVPL